jgi:hypothetical protein
MASDSSEEAGASAPALPTLQRTEGLAELQQRFVVNWSIEVPLKDVSFSYGRGRKKTGVAKLTDSFALLAKKEPADPDAAMVRLQLFLQLLASRAFGT